MKTKLAAADRLALHSALGEASLARGLVWAQSVALKPYNVVRLGQLTDTQLVEAMAAALASVV